MTTAASTSTKTAAYSIRLRPRMVHMSLGRNGPGPDSGARQKLGDRKVTSVTCRGLLDCRLGLDSRNVASGGAL